MDFDFDFEAVSGEEAIVIRQQYNTTSSYVLFECRHWNLSNFSTDAVCKLSIACNTTMHPIVIRQTHFFKNKNKIVLYTIFLQRPLLVEIENHLQYTLRFIIWHAFELFSPLNHRVYISTVQLLITYLKTNCPYMLFGASGVLGIEFLNVDLDKDWKTFCFQKQRKHSFLTSSSASSPLKIFKEMQQRPNWNTICQIPKRSHTWFSIEAILNILHRRARIERQRSVGFAFVVVAPLTRSLVGRP